MALKYIEFENFYIVGGQELDLMPKTNKKNYTCEFDDLPVRLSKTKINELLEIELKDLKEDVKIFQAVADESRLKMLEALKGGELCVCVLVELSCLKPSTVSYHLSMLTDAGLVKSRREASFQIYTMTPRGDLLLNILKKMRK